MPETLPCAKDAEENGTEHPALGSLLRRAHRTSLGLGAEQRGRVRARQGAGRAGRRRAGRRWAGRRHRAGGRRSVRGVPTSTSRVAVRRSHPLSGPSPLPVLSAGAGQLHVPATRPPPPALQVTPGQTAGQVARGLVRRQRPGASSQPPFTGHVPLVLWRGSFPSELKMELTVPGQPVDLPVPSRVTRRTLGECWPREQEPVVGLVFDRKEYP